VNEKNTARRLRETRPRVGAMWSVPIALAVTGLIVLSASQNVSSQQSKATSASSQVERGKYLVTVEGCNDCHTPWKMGAQGPEPDMSRMLSGHPEGMKMPPPPAASGPWMWSGSVTMTAYAGPWGVSYAANLTPDQNSGLGIWTEEMFLNALKTGKHMGTSRQIQPPMPWNWYGKMTEPDLKAIYAYLRTIPPIKNTVPDYEPPK
jgi:mono/diheme cytochrome c family protein